MDKKKLVELVDRLKKSGIKASITKPRKTLLMLQQPAAPSN